MTVRISYDEKEQRIVLDEVDAVTEMRDTVRKATKDCYDEFAKEKEGLRACLTGRLMDEVDRVGSGMKRMEKLRGKMSDRYRNYTCTDDSQVTTTPWKMTEFFHLGEKYDVDMYLDTESAKIWSVENFITEEECDILMDATKDKLERASTVGQDGEGEYSTARRAQQASYSFDSDLRSDLLW